LFPLLVGGFGRFDSGGSSVVKSGRCSTGERLGTLINRQKETHPSWNLFARVDMVNGRKKKK